MDVRFNLVAPEQVLGALKATGSTDPDVLFAAKEEFAARYRPLRWFGIWGLVSGALATVLVITAFIGIPLMILGWWWLRRAKRNLATIDATFARFTGASMEAAPPSGAPMRIAGSAMLVLALSAAHASAQDAVPADQAGDWVPAKAGCASPLKLVLAGSQATLVNGADRLTTGNVGVTYSYFGASYQGISFVLMPDYDKSQPYVVYFNTDEKKGQTTVEFNDASLRKRFPLEKTVLKRCPASDGAAGAQAAPAPASKQARAAAPGDACGGAARCVGTRTFTATLADLRLSRYGNDKVLTFSVRFRNLLEQPLYLGFVQGSGLMIDDQGMRYTLASGSNAVRGMGLVNASTFDPKFVLQPGESGDVRVELVSRAQQGQIFGTVYDLDFAVREIEAMPGNQFSLGKEHSLQYRKLVPDDGGAPAAAAATPVSTASAGAAAPAAAPAPDADACAGTARCCGAGPFVVTVGQTVESRSGGYQTFKMNLKVRNLTTQPMSLGFQSGSATAIGNNGDRYRWRTDNVKGIGFVTSSEADPQFTLGPGQERTFTLGYYKGIYKGTLFDTSWSADFVLQQLEVLPSRQVRSVREYAISFSDVTAGSSGGAGSASGSTGGSEGVAETAGKFVDGLFKKKK
jgi:hypothetical protein